MDFEKYNKVWNKIRSSHINENDAILFAGYGKGKYKICDYFLNNEYLNLHYIQEISAKDIAEKKGISEADVLLNIATEINVLKVRLAEKGIIDEISLKEDTIYYTYIRKRIAQKSVLYVHLIDEISCKDIGRALNVGCTGVRRVLKEDKESAKILLKNNKIKNTDVSVALYTKVFGEYYKTLKDVPVEYLNVLDTKIKANALVEGFIYKKFKYCDGTTKECLDLIDDIELSMKQFLKSVNKRKNRRL